MKLLKLIVICTTIIITSSILAKRIWQTECIEDYKFVISPNGTLVQIFEKQIKRFDLDGTLHGGNVVLFSVPMECGE